MSLLEAKEIGAQLVQAFKSQAERRANTMQVKLFTKCICPKCRKVMKNDPQQFVWCDNTECDWHGIKYELPEIELRPIQEEDNAESTGTGDEDPLRT